MMDIDTINLEGLVIDEGLIIYEMIWEFSALDHSINMPQAFWMGLSFKVTSRSQENLVDLLWNLCRDVLADWPWVDERVLYTNL